MDGRELRAFAFVVIPLCVSLSGCGAGGEAGIEESDVFATASEALTAVTPLVSGQTESGLSGSGGSARYFSLDVPAGASRVTFGISGGQGDADLYVRFGELPTRSTFDARSAGRGNRHELTTTLPRSGTWFVRVDGRRGYSGVALRGTWQAAEVGPADAGAPNPSTPVAGTPDAEGSHPAFEGEVLRLINQHRSEGADCGGTRYPPAPALSMNAELARAARLHSADMATRGYFSHLSQDGRTFSERIRAAGYTGSSPLGENIAAGHSTPEKVMQTWMESPGHCANIMNGGFRGVGVGYALEPASPYRHYWTLNFGGSS